MRFQAMGVCAGDTMSFVTRNSPQVYYLAYGCMMMDVLVAPSFPELNAGEQPQAYSNFNYMQYTLKYMHSSKKYFCDMKTAAKNSFQNH